MATSDSPDNQASHLTAALIRLDPGGAYWRYAGYVSAIVGIAACGGYVTSLLTGSNASYLGAIYTGILTCLALLFLKPTASRYPYKEIAAAGVALLIGAGVGGATGDLPAVSQPMTVLIAFAGFYVRRWSEPLPMAGLLLVLSFVISQILAPFTPASVIYTSILPLLVIVSIGFWFLPRRVFTRAFVLSVERMRAGVPGELKLRMDSEVAVTASVGRVDSLLRQVNDARAQADLYNPVDASRHVALMQTAATVARSWQNAADSMYRAAADELDQNGTTSAIREAEAAVGRSLTHPTRANRSAAEAALSDLDALLDTLAGRQDEGERSEDADLALFHLVGTRLALSHLMNAIAELDSNLVALRDENR